MKTAKDLGLTVPTVHLNGTSLQGLMDGYAEAASAVRKAQEEIASNGPNARDYYVQDPSAWGKAKEQHQARLDKLQGVLEELEALVEAVYEQRSARWIR